MTTTTHTELHTWLERIWVITRCGYALERVGDDSYNLTLNIPNSPINVTSCPSAKLITILKSVVTQLLAQTDYKANVEQ